jgi:hypothetical protein
MTDIVDDLVLKLHEALTSNSVVDISDLIQNGSIVVISKSGMGKRYGVQLETMPLVSSNFAAYEYVMKLFGSEYQIYITLYKSMYGDGKPEIKYSRTSNENELYYATRYGPLSEVERLIRQGVNIHYNNDEPLHTAINENAEDQINIIRYLLEHEALFRDLKDAYQLLNVVTSNEKAENLDLLQYLIEAVLLSPNGLPSSQYPIINAIVRGHIRTVQYLIEHGADIHIDTDAPLRMAFYFGQEHIFVYLLKNGANLHVNNNEIINGIELGQFEHMRQYMPGG